MSASRFKKLFGEKLSKSKGAKVTKKPAQSSQQGNDPKHSSDFNKDPAKDKAEIARYQEIISKKLKDPAMAKKAAQIIEQMLHEKKSNKSNKKAS